MSKIFANYKPSSFISAVEENVLRIYFNGEVAINLTIKIDYTCRIHVTVVSEIECSMLPLFACVKSMKPQT